MPFSNTFPYVAAPLQGYQVPVTTVNQGGRGARPAPLPPPAERRQRETDETDTRSERPQPSPRSRCCSAASSTTAPSATPSRARSSPAARDRRSSRRASRPGAAARQRPSSKLQADAARRPGRRALARRARPRLPAAGARDRRPDLLHEVGARCCDRALRLAPRDLIATSGLGSLALSRHRFAEALVLGRRAHAISPTTALNYGVIGDALVELGRYPAAFQAFDTMATLRPGLSSYARVSHGLELLGRVPEAIDDDAARRRGRGGPGRARGLDALPARQALLVDRSRRRRRAPEPRRPARLPRLPLRARLALADRGGEGRTPRRDRARAAGGRPDPAAAVRGPARRPLPRQRPAAAGAASSTR